MSALDARATRWLARRALDAGVLDPVTWEFIHDEPERAHECTEFVRWLADDTDTEGGST